MNYEMIFRPYNCQLFTTIAFQCVSPRPFQRSERAGSFHHWYLLTSYDSTLNVLQRWIEMFDKLWRRKLREWPQNCNKLTWRRNVCYRKKVAITAKHWNHNHYLNLFKLNSKWTRGCGWGGCYVCALICVSEHMCG